MNPTSLNEVRLNNCALTAKVDTGFLRWFWRSSLFRGRFIEWSGISYQWQISSTDWPSIHIERQVNRIIPCKKGSIVLIDGIILDTDPTCCLSQWFGLNVSRLNSVQAPTVIDYLLDNVSFNYSFRWLAPYGYPWSLMVHKQGRILEQLRPMYRSINILNKAGHFFSLRPQQMLSRQDPWQYLLFLIVTWRLMDTN